MGKSARRRRSGRHLGGLSSGGLGFTDTGNKAVIGGLSREFYQRIWQHYDSPAAWKWQKREEYGNKGQGTPAIDGAQRTMWIFEPHVAEQVFEDLVRSTRFAVHRDEWLDRSEGRRRRTARRIASITMLSGKTLHRADVHRRHLRGRSDGRGGRRLSRRPRAQSAYGEKWNGVQTGVLHHRHHFGVLHATDQPLRRARRSEERRAAADQHASRRATTARPTRRSRPTATAMCLTDHPENRIAVREARGLRSAAVRAAAARSSRPAGARRSTSSIRSRTARPTRNNHGPFSTDNIGFNYDYPEASYERRREILKEHETYQKGWLYFIANDPRVPKDVQERDAAVGAARRTSSRTTAAGRIRSTSARRAAWSGSS